MLQHLEDLAQEEVRLVVRPPTGFRIDGVVPEMALIRSVQDRAGGKIAGLRTLSEILTQREIELATKIKEQQ